MTVSPAPSPFEVHRTLIGEGLPLVTVELPHLHAASIIAYARVGSRYERPRDNGLSHFLEHMLFRGTARLPDAYQLNRAIEELGGTLYAETGRDYSLYQISVHPDSVAEGLALFGEIFASPVFSDLEVERRIILEEMLEDVDDEMRLTNIDDLARQVAWQGHPLSYRITGPVENVKRFTASDLRRHLKSFYGASNMVLAVSGAVRHRSVVAHARRAMAQVPRGMSRTIRPPAAPKADRPAQLVYVDHEGSQSSVQLLFRGLAETDPDYPALLMLSRIIDDGMSTRLHHRLCDELGLAYYVSASLETFVDTGLLEFDAAARHGSVNELVAETLALCQTLATDGPRLDELHKAQRRYRWDLERSFDDPDVMAGWWAGASLFLAPVPHTEKLARVGRVTLDDVRRVARRLFRPERLTVAVVGQLTERRQERLRRLLERFAAP
jgi:predicted Zn-dependent peptidase